jgi:hypothetical protein
MSQQVIIFDTTLRDGEQALQASLSVKEKLQIALALERMGVDVMEVGFPVSSPGDFESVQTIARTIKNSRVCGLARCVEKDIDVAAESLKVAEAFRIHTFIATSPMHIATKLRSTLDEVIERAVYMVKRARNYTDDVEFSCEDAGRTPIEDLAAWWKPPSMPAPKPSTSRTPSATPCRLSSPISSPACMTAYRTLIKRLSPSTPTMIWVWPWAMPSQPSTPARVR